MTSLSKNSYITNKSTLILLVDTLDLMGEPSGSKTRMVDGAIEWISSVHYFPHLLEENDIAFIDFRALFF